MPSATGTTVRALISLYSSTCEVCHNRTERGQHIYWNPANSAVCHFHCAGGSPVRAAEALATRTHQPARRVNRSRPRRPSGSATGRQARERARRAANPRVASADQAERWGQADDPDEGRTSAMDATINAASEIAGPETVWADGERTYEEAHAAAERILAASEAERDGTAEHAQRERDQEAEAVMAGEGLTMTDAYGQPIPNYAERVREEADRAWAGMMAADASIADIPGAREMAYHTARNIVEGRCPDGCCP